VADYDPTKKMPARRGAATNLEWFIPARNIVRLRRETERFGGHFSGAIFGF